MGGALLGAFDVPEGLLQLDPVYEYEEYDTEGKYVLHNSTCDDALNGEHVLWAYWWITNRVGQSYPSFYLNVGSKKCLVLC